MSYKSIKVEQSVYEKLSKAGAFNESFDTVLSKLLEQAGKNWKMSDGALQAK